MQYAFIPRLAACIATLAAPAGAIAQAPSNDNFEAPLIIGSPALPASYAGTTVNATAQVGEPNHANEIGGNIASNSVWYRWSPAATTPVTITALNASFDAALAVYTSPGGLLTDLAKIAASDFFFAADESVSFTASGGTTYYIAVDGFEDSETPMDSGTFTLLLEVASTVENDSFANAITVGNLPAVIASTNVGATIEEGEPTHFTGIDNVNTNSVWFRWVAPADMCVTADTFGALADIVLAAYRGTSLNNLVLVAGADNTFTDERVTIDAVAGQTYYFVVDGYSKGAQGGETAFDFAMIECPYNDDFADAADLGSELNVYLPDDNFGASIEANEPEHANLESGNQASNSIWYRWTAPGAVPMQVLALTADFDSVLSIYTGSSLATLIPVVSSDRYLQGYESAVFRPTAGVQYSFAIEGHTLTGHLAPEGLVDFFLRPAPPYVLWLERFSLEGSDAYPESTPQDDGITNLEKLAFGLHPELPVAIDVNRGNLPRLSKEDGQVYLEYTVAPGDLAPTGTNPITHTGQISIDLIEWEDRAPAAVGGNTFRVPLNAGEFGRVKISDPNINLE